MLRILASLIGEAGLFMSNRRNFLERTQAEAVRSLDPSPQRNAKHAQLMGFGDFKNVFVAHWRVLAFASMVSVAAGLVYVLAAEREYSASAKVRVELQKTELLPGPSVASTFLNIETALLESDVDLARSLSLLRNAADKLNLAEDPDYNRSSLLADMRARISKILRPANLAAKQKEQADELRLIELANRTRIDRVGQSLLIRFAYKSSNPERAAFVANEIADAFIEAQLASQKQATSKITASLQDRLNLMRSEVAAGDTAVAKYKAQNVLAEAPGGSELERQLSELNNQAAAAGAEAVTLRNRLDRLSAAAANEDLDTLLNVEASDPALSAIQQELRRAMAQGDERARMRLRENALALVASIVRTRRAAVEFAESRAAQLNAELQRVKQNVTQTAFHHVELADLKRHADSRRVIYEATLTAFNRFVQNEALPMARFKIAEEATPPALPTWPKAPLIMATALLLGLSLASGYILLREGMRRSFLTTRELSGAIGAIAIAVPQAKELGALSGFEGYAAAVATRKFGMDKAMASLRRGVGLDAATSSLVVGVSSTQEHEGKTSVAALFAAHLACVGMRVLLVDLADGALTRRLNVGSDEHRDSTQSPSLVHSIADNVHLLSADALQRLPYGSLPPDVERLASLRGGYDVVVIDMPALEDAGDLASSVDKIILVVEWNRTTQDSLAEALENAPALARKIACAVLNKVQWRKIQHLAPGDFARLKPSSQPDRIKHETKARNV